MQRFNRFPVTLYRIQPSLPVNLREYDTQRALNRLSFDLKLHDGLVLPMQGNKFHTPNGMSLRQLSPKMESILNSFKGSSKKLRIYRMQEYAQVPEDMILILEHTDHYSLQVKIPMTLEQFNVSLTSYLQTLPSMSMQEFFEFYNDPDDFDN
jgi:hypothetical protein